MKTFPKLDEFSIDELIIIVYNTSEDWQDEAVDYAKYLLKSKGVTDTFAKKRVLELEKETYKLWEKEIERRKTESYNPFDLIFMTILWPKYLLRDWHLKSHGYILKRKQRLMCLSLGFTICLLVVSYEILSYPSREKEKLNKFSQIVQADSIANSKIDWTGDYIFIDSLKDQKERITWELALEKENNKHKGLLTLTKGKEKVSIPCIGLVKDNGLELYPDKNATLLNKIDVGYYDNLFILCRHENEIVTIWAKVKPYFDLRNNVSGIFKKSKRS
jgi:hypothetical protein